MKKKYFIYTSLIVIVGLLICFSSNTKVNNKEKEVVYNGNNLLISVDGKKTNTLPTSGIYYLVNYDCKSSNTKVTWDKDNYKLNVSNGNKKGDVYCNLEFKSNPKLAEMPVGSYVDYTGVGGTVGSTTVNCKLNGSASSSTAADETEAPNSCLGQNAREDLDTSGYTYGYCYGGNHKYYTTGWRIAYIDGNNKPVIVSAGSPECNARESIAGNSTYIKMANSKAMKYCNSDLVDGNCSCLDDDDDGYCDCTDENNNGLCDEIEINKVDAWSIGDIDFYNMTKAISGYGKRLTSGSSSLGDNGGSLGTTLYCGNKYSYEECGYSNDLIDNGGYYWFSARCSSSDTYGVDWYPNDRFVDDLGSYTSAYGLRPVISLSSSVIVIGGSGTMDDPYEIANNSFRINDGSTYVSANDDVSNVKLSLVDSTDIATMCISVNSSGCSNYVAFSNTYYLDWSGEADGEKVVYVYYKDSAGKVVASMSKKVILDTVAPSNNSISINTSSVPAVFTLSSSGASYMCFSINDSNASNCTKWVNYATSYSYKLTSEGSITVYAFFKDNAGNVSSVSKSITYAMPCMPVNEVLNLTYTGSSLNSIDLEYKMCAGSYRLQVWGAQGGNNGGNGGYSTGDITLAGTERLIFTVGGTGGRGGGGFNGGGATGSGGGGGGGATDIRINDESTYARVIVAGGGGGKGQDSCATGGAGGGTSGIGGTSQGSCGTQAGAGTQTAGGAVGVYSGTNGANAGTFGIGGTAADANYDGGGGGGGWYGGGAGASAGWSNGGGGGSGFVYTSSSTTPSGYTVSTRYRLTNASTTDGTQSIPKIDGSGTETGHSGNGHIKVTRLS